MSLLRELLDQRHALENMAPSAAINRQLSAVRRRIQAMHDARFGIEWGESIPPERLTIEGHVNRNPAIAADKTARIEVKPRRM